MCPCLKYIVHPSKWRVELGLWEVIFSPVPEEIVYSFFNFLFDIFCNSLNLAYVLQLGSEYLIFNHLFTPQRESHSIPDMGSFAMSLLMLSHLELSRIELPKLTPSILMEIATIPVALVDQFYFYMHQLIKAWLFEKINFELDIIELVCLCDFA